MKSLNSLAAAFEEHINTDRDNFDFWAEDGELHWSGSRVSTFDNSLILWRDHYSAVFSFQSYTGDANKLFLILMTWLEEHGGDRDELGPPEFDAEKVSDGIFDVEIKCYFEDEAYGVETDDGFDLIDEPEIVVAETVGKVTIKNACK